MALQCAHGEAGHHDRLGAQARGRRNAHSVVVNRRLSLAVQIAAKKNLDAYPRGRCSKIGEKKSIFGTFHPHQSVFATLSILSDSLSPPLLSLLPSS
jgi:hypothetical protein